MSEDESKKMVERLMSHEHKRRESIEKARKIKLEQES
jgi:hypothetical protein